MSDSILRVVISTIGTLLVALAFAAGYISGGRGWWWAAFGIVFIYLIIFRLVDA